MKRKVLSVIGGMSVAVLLSGCGVGVIGHDDYVGYKKAPYIVRGQKYYPMSVQQALNYEEVGIASWYDESKFLGMVRGDTAIGEKVAPWDISAAHKTLPLPCKVKVTNLSNGKSLKMRVNDRGPYIEGRIIDLTPRAARKLGFIDDGLTNVKVEVISVGDGDYKVKKKKSFWFF